MDIVERADLDNRSDLRPVATEPEHMRRVIYSHGSGGTGHRLVLARHDNKMLWWQGPTRHKEGRRFKQGRPVINTPGELSLIADVKEVHHLASSVTLYKGPRLTKAVLAEYAAGIDGFFNAPVSEKLNRLHTVVVTDADLVERPDFGPKSLMGLQVTFPGEHDRPLEGMVVGQSTNTAEVVVARFNTQYVVHWMLAKPITQD